MILPVYFHLFNRDGSLYMKRWWVVPRLSWLPFCVRLHYIASSDLDRDMHDHPSWSVSFLLRGSYEEIMPADRHQHPSHDDSPDCQKRRTRYAGDFIFRRATDRHRLHLRTPGVWSLFIMGRRKNDWGFYTKDGKVPWEKYVYG